jgi:hypothetical protein
MASDDSRMFRTVNRYVDNVRRQTALREEIAGLHEEADKLLDQIEADGRTIKTAMTMAGKQVIQAHAYGPLLMLQGCTLKVAELGSALSLPYPEPSVAEPSNLDLDQAEADAKLALDNAIEDCNEANDPFVTTWAKLPAVEGQVAS